MIDHEDWCCAKGCPGVGFCVDFADCDQSCKCILAVIKAAEAEAWDEGVKVAWIAALNGERCGENPYR